MPIQTRRRLCREFGRAFSGAYGEHAGRCISSRRRATEHACYIGDLIPTHHHLDPTWVMGYDLDPLRCIAERKRFYARAIPERWLVLFTHDHQMPAAYVEWNEKGKPVVKEVGSRK